MRPIDVLCGIVVAFAWGCNIVSMKISVIEFPALFSNLIRFCIAALVLLPFLTKMNILSKPFLKTTFFYATSISLATMSVRGDSSASLLILLFQLSVPFTAILSSIFLKDSLDARKIIGIIISFIGISIVLLKPHMQYNFMSSVFIIGAAGFWALFNINLKQIKISNQMSFLGWLILLSIPYLAVICYVFDHFKVEVLYTASLLAWSAITASALISTVVGFGIWSYLVQKYPLTIVAPFTLLAPIFGTLFSIIIFCETLSIAFVIGTAITMIGIITVMIGRSKIAK